MRHVPDYVTIPVAICMAYIVMTDAIQHVVALFSHCPQ